MEKSWTHVALFSKSTLYEFKDAKISCLDRIKTGISRDQGRGEVGTDFALIQKCFFDMIT